MAKHLQKKIPGIHDFELGYGRETPVSYFLTLPDAGKADGLVFVVHGFGGDKHHEYSQKLREFIADRYNMATVAVHPHAFQNRPTPGGKNIFLELRDILYINGRLRYYGCPLLPKKKILSLEESLPFLNCLEAQVGYALKRLPDIKKLLHQGQYELLPAVIQPPNGEFHTFGIMQALDHICVLYDLYHEISFDRGNIIAMGSSQGGYIADIMSKLAPSTFSAVFDNSAYPEPPERFVVGRDLNIPELYHRIGEHVMLGCFLKSGWTLDEKAKNYYSEERRRIRSFLFPEDIKAMARYGSCKTQYRFYHSRHDKLAAVEKKESMAKLLQEQGFDVRLVIMDEKDVDGRFVKNLDHGMNLSMKIMFANLFETVTRRAEQTDIDLQSKIIYRGSNLTYSFTYTPAGVIPEVL